MRWPRRFSYSPGAFRVLCHQFATHREEADSFFQDVRHGPQSAPSTRQVRTLAVAMRKKNLSVYDIQRELGCRRVTGSRHQCSVVLMREEVSARLPRRRDDEPAGHGQAGGGAVANVEALDPFASLLPARRVGGLFLFVPLMREINLTRVLGKGRSSGIGHDSGPSRPSAAFWR